MSNMSFKKFDINITHTYINIHMYICMYVCMSIYKICIYKYTHA